MMAKPIRSSSAALAVAIAGALVLSACGGTTVSGEPTSPSAKPSTVGSATPSSSTPAPADPSTSPSDAGPSASRPPSSALKLVWGDEFDEPAGTPPNPEHWGYNRGDGTGESVAGWGNNELESYTDDPKNAATDGKGNLVITARAAPATLDCYYGPCKYTSARLLTQGKYELTYGRVEARIKVPAGTGLWPAFWMLGTNITSVSWPASGEIDVMENVGRQPNKLYGTLHGPGYSGSNGFGNTLDLPDPLAGDFHVFAVDWQQDRIVWTVDGQEYHRASPADVAPNEWAYNHAFFLLLNLAVGGNFGGPVAPDTKFPASMVVDYVRIYELGP
jgi:beta-glucanase (GH16 family)